MKTRTINTYSFSELSEKAKQYAKDGHAEAMGYAWGEDAIESIKALTLHFQGKMKNWEIDFFNGTYSHATFDMPEMEEQEIKNRLNKLGSYNKETLRGDGECKLTGYCMDEDAIDGFRRAFHGGENDLSKLMDAAFESWIKAVHEDCKYQYSDEAFEETADANEYEYYENGEIA